MSSGVSICRRGVDSDDEDPYRTDTQRTTEKVCSRSIFSLSTLSLCPPLHFLCFFRKLSPVFPLTLSSTYKIFGITLFFFFSCHEVVCRRETPSVFLLGEGVDTGVGLGSGGLTQANVPFPPNSNVYFSSND